MFNIGVCLKQVPDPLSIEIEPLTGVINYARLAYITKFRQRIRLAKPRKLWQTYCADLIPLWFCAVVVA